MAGGRRAEEPAEYRSITVARYNLLEEVGISVMSPTHLVLAREAVKSRLTRSGNFAAALSCLVKPLRRLTIRATRPCRRIESATLFSLTDQPASRRSTTSRGDPCKPRAVLNAAVTAVSSLARRFSVLVGARSRHL